MPEPGARPAAINTLVAERPSPYLSLVNDTVKAFTGAVDYPQRRSDFDFLGQIAITYGISQRFGILAKNRLAFEQVAFNNNLDKVRWHAKRHEVVNVDEFTDAVSESCMAIHEAVGKVIPQKSDLHKTIRAILETDIAAELTNEMLATYPLPDNFAEAMLKDANFEARLRRFKEEMPEDIREEGLSDDQKLLVYLLRREFSLFEDKIDLSTRNIVNWNREFLGGEVFTPLRRYRTTEEIQPLTERQIGLK